MSANQRQRPTPTTYVTPYKRVHAIHQYALKNAKYKGMASAGREGYIDASIWRSMLAGMKKYTAEAAVKKSSTWQAAKEEYTGEQVWRSAAAARAAGNR
ncbi:hypothetical protein NPIL_117611 [Nephila pilipes]|uniref:Uncharacterized protein n=1 Tax=Nephila pilipes TaxID=299642 RepID=A0A8X6QV18_NEPPI|nr:hypothetical protein NPIL_117611 [Nephila pilipes]